MSTPMAPPSDPIAATRSPLNPGDAMLAKKSGQVSPDMKFGEFMESQFGIQWEEPLQSAMEKMKGAVKNATPQGKIQSMAQMAPKNQVPGQPQRPMPQGRPIAAQEGLAGLMGGR